MYLYYQKTKLNPILGRMSGLATGTLMQKQRNNALKPKLEQDDTKLRVKNTCTVNQRSQHTVQTKTPTHVMSLNDRTVNAASKHHLCSR